jgi:hypothetical protein
MAAASLRLLLLQLIHRHQPEAVAADGAAVPLQQHHPVVPFPL